MLVVALPKNDSAPAKTDPLFDQWVSNLVDIYNEAMQQIQTKLDEVDARLIAGGL